ncbi:MAG: response regulator, partial [Janthinobacterium lividum]
GGTSFSLYFPAAAREVALPAAPGPQNQRPLEGTVLLVEDDRAVRMVVERALVRHGLSVIAAADGDAALEVLDNGGQRIDVLVSDVVMPGMDGVMLLTKARERQPGLHVVLMSGYAEPPQRRALDRTGVVFLAKPFAVADLVEAVRGAMTS